MNYRNQVFVTKGNGEKINLKSKVFVKEEKSKVTDEGFYYNQNTIEKCLNKKSNVFRRQTSTKRVWDVKISNFGVKEKK